VRRDRSEAAKGVACSKLNCELYSRIVREVRRHERMVEAGDVDHGVEGGDELGGQHVIAGGRAFYEDRLPNPKTGPIFEPPRTLEDATPRKHPADPRVRGTIHSRHPSSISNNMP
jgi:hypothetical protein